MKKLILIVAALFPLVLLAQTVQLIFTYKNGITVGRSKVMDMPVTIFQPWVPQGQLLIFYPPAYAAGKKCGLIVFNAGDGEQVGLDVTLVNKNSLPRMIAAGLTPYSLVGKDTLFWVVASIHNNAGSAYRSQLAQILPWILDKSGIQYDPKRVWLTGLSGGGSATWASVMIDTTLSRRITGIIPLANGGYDGFLSSLMANLVTACKQGVYFFPYIGTQDPGYNASGFFAYDAVVKNYALPDHYHPHVIPGGTHSWNVWDVPFNSRVIWDSLGLIGQPPAPPAKTVHARLMVDSTVIHYPNTSVIFTDSSTGSSFSSWGAYSYPTGYPGRWTGYQTMAGELFSNLVPGSYGVQLIASDGNGITDTARAFITVVGPPTCPICPVCPPRRKAIGFTIDAVTGVFKFTYDDGNP